MPATKDMKLSTLGTIVLCCCGVAVMMDIIIYPITDTLYSVFADQPVAVLNTLFTGTSLMLMFGTLLCGVVAQRIGSKTILAVAYTVFCVFGVSSAWVAGTGNLYMLLAWRLITGFAAGFCTTAGESLIAEFFVDEKKRSRMMGIFCGTYSTVSIIMSFAAGLIAAVDWTAVFYIYLVAVPICVGSYAVIPKTKPVGHVESKKEHVATKGDIPWVKLLPMFVAAFIFNALVAVFLSFNSVYLAETQLGGVTIAGTLGSVICIGSMIMCFAFGFIYMKLKRASSIIFFAIMGVGYFILSLIPSLPVVFILGLILGSGYGFAYTYYITYASCIVPPNRIPLAIAIANIGMSLGMFVGPYVAPTFETVFGVDTYAAAMPYMAVVFIAGAVLAIICFVKAHKSGEDQVLAE